MLDAELAEIVANLRVLGTDIADVEVKNSHQRLGQALAVGGTATATS
jgi:ATP-dependent DNA helicase RecG